MKGRRAQLLHGGWRKTQEGMLLENRSRSLGLAALKNGRTKSAVATIGIGPQDGTTTGHKQQKKEEVKTPRAQSRPRVLRRARKDCTALARKKRAGARRKCGARGG